MRASKEIAEMMSEYAEGKLLPGATPETFHRAKVEFLINVVGDVWERMKDLESQLPRTLALHAEVDRLRGMFDTTRQRVLSAMAVDDVGKSWSWIESTLAVARAEAATKDEEIDRLRQERDEARDEKDGALIREEGAVAIEAEVDRLRGLLVDGLNSADCTWEERNEGHDWADWCKRARAALAGKE